MRCSLQREQLSSIVNKEKFNAYRDRAGYP